jgi:ABC-type transporter Mla maintaining outer membrane lipid asymmetry permease subunit MlaE
MGKIIGKPVALHQAARLRGAALADLWQHRASWQLPLPRALMRRERDTLLAALMPTVAVIALMVGFLLFVTLPSAIGDAYPTALGTLWPVWAIQAAPMAAAQLLAMQRAPTLALELSHRHQRGEFDALRRLQASPAIYPCVPLLMAHGAVAAAASFLMIALSLLAGFAGALALAVGDFRQMLDAVFSLVSPLDWLRSLFTAATLGVMCSLAAMLYAWPGSQTGDTQGVDAHKLGVRVMMVSSLAVIVSALLLNWVISLLGFLKG